MDRRLRELERLAATGDPDAQAGLMVERVRGGQLDANNVTLAAHFGHQIARIAYGQPEVVVKCPCARRRDTSDEDEDSPAAACYRCQGRGLTKLPDDLMAAVSMAGDMIADSTLLRWATDCVSHVRENIVLEEEEVRVPNVGADRGAWLASVTWAYRLAGHRATERDWQKRRLGELLLL